MSRKEKLLKKWRGDQVEIEPPQSREEKILHKILGATVELEPPQSRVEKLLTDIADNPPGPGPTPTGTIEITENGEYDVKSYAKADVDVPEPSGTVNISTNGDHSVKNYATAHVAVPEPTGTKSIAANGITDVKDYEYADVNVPGIVPSGTKNITENGTYNVENFASAVVNVPSSGGDTLGDLLTGTLGDYTNDSLTTIGNYAFYNSGTGKITLSKVKEIHYMSFNAYRGDISLPALETINETMNFTNSGITEAVFPKLKSVGSGGGNFDTFYGCTSLRRAVFGATSQKNLNLYNRLFYGCTALEEVDFYGLNIYQNVFYGCSSLEKIVIRTASQVCNLNNINSLQGTPIESGTGYIYVPDSLVNSYKAATNWAIYADQIKPISELS